jgi:hypothetical protein
MFDLKWTLHDNEVGYRHLTKDQIVNHYEGNQDITTKGALCRTLRGMPWELDESCDKTLPASFDVSDAAEWDAFVAAFRYAVYTHAYLITSVYACTCLTSI